MKVFICWSGRRSQQFASIIKTWLQGLMPGRIDARLSVDIRKGTLWFHELDKALDGAQLGIVCLTDEALGSAWIHYEAGILSRALRETRRAARRASDGPEVFPVLCGIESSRLSGPLAAYQSTAAHSREDMWRLVQVVGRKVGLRTDLQKRFDKGWIRLLGQMRAVSPVPISEVFPDVEEIFRGKAFDEPLEQQLSQDWLGRYDAIRRVHWRLSERLGPVKAACRTFVSDLFNQLTAETEAYARDLSMLIGRPRFPIGDDGRVLLEQEGIGHACEMRRTRILTLAAQLVDPRQAAVFENAFRFTTAASTEERKKLIHREAAALRVRPSARAPKEAERRHWLDSDWDLDHILFYELLRDRPLKSFGLEDAIRHAAMEFERIRFRATETRPSLMALYYSLDGVRRLLRSHGRAARKRAQSDARMLVAEVLEFINQPGRGANAPIRTALKDRGRIPTERARKERAVRRCQSHTCRSAPAPPLLIAGSPDDGIRSPTCRDAHNTVSAGGSRTGAGVASTERRHQGGGIAGDGVDGHAQREHALGAGADILDRHGGHTTNAWIAGDRLGNAGAHAFADERRRLLLDHRGDPVEAETPR